MPFTKQTMNNGGAPGIDAGFLNTIQTQYDVATNSIEQHLLKPFVLFGGQGTIHGGLTKQMDVSQCIYFPQQTDNTLRARLVNATFFTTVTASTTYFLDYNPDGTTSFATTHSGVANFVPIASITTDGSGNIAVITDVRPTAVNLFPAFVGAPAFAGTPLALIGTHNTAVGLRWSAGNGAPGALAANEIYIQL